MTAFRLRAFFDQFPVLLNPLLDCLFITLDSPCLGLLRGKSDSRENAADVVDVIADAEFSLDEVGNARATPELSVETMAARPFDEPSPELLVLRGRHQSRAPRSQLRLESGFAADAITRHPLLNGLSRDLEFASHAGLCELSALDTANGVKSPLLHLFCCPSDLHPQANARFEHTLRSGISSGQAAQGNYAGVNSHEPIADALLITAEINTN